MNLPSYSEVESAVEQTLGESFAYKPLIYALGGVKTVSSVIHQAVQLVAHKVKDAAKVVAEVRNRVFAILRKILGTAVTMLKTLITFVDSVLDKLEYKMGNVVKKVGKMARKGAGKVVEIEKAAADLMKDTLKSGAKMLDDGFDAMAELW